MGDGHVHGPSAYLIVDQASVDDDGTAEFEMPVIQDLSAYGYGECTCARIVQRPSVGNDDLTAGWDRQIPRYLDVSTHCDRVACNALRNQIVEVRGGNVRSIGIVRLHQHRCTEDRQYRYRECHQQSGTFAIDHIIRSGRLRQIGRSRFNRT